MIKQRQAQSVSLTITDLGQTRITFYVFRIYYFLSTIERSANVLIISFWWYENKDHAKHAVDNGSMHKHQ